MYIYSTTAIFCSEIYEYNTYYSKIDFSSEYTLIKKSTYFGIGFIVNLIPKKVLFRLYFRSQTTKKASMAFLDKSIGKIYNYFLYWTYDKTIWFAFLFSTFPSHNFSVKFVFFYTDVRKNKRFRSSFSTSDRKSRYDVDTYLNFQ